jgi:hypothetical protein
MMDPKEVAAVRALFSEHGVTGDDIRRADPERDDEAVFVISTTAVAGMNERELHLGPFGIATAKGLGRDGWTTMAGPDRATRSVLKAGGREDAARTLPQLRQLASDPSGCLRHLLVAAWRSLPLGLVSRCPPTPPNLTSDSA